jgi:N-acetyl-gamma-glutamyl-phosphate reductase
MINVAIAGGTGYTAGELLRLLQNHPAVRIVSVISSSNAGAEISSVHRELLGEITLKFSDQAEFCKVRDDVDVLFLCLGHGLSRKFLDETCVPESCRIIDLGNDFRNDNVYNGEYFIYGLSELYREKIRDARLIANPGCFATSIILGAAPLASAGDFSDELHIHAVTGSTGAGRSLSESGHFSYRDSNISVYKPFTHQHLAEIKNTLREQSSGQSPQINFIPLRGDFTRGIFASIYTKNGAKREIEEIAGLYKTFYKESPFVFISDSPLSLKEVVNTNKVLVHLEKHNGYIHITTVIDNLLKGASGQALQNMNLMMGFEENCGLRLKGSAF